MVAKGPAIKDDTAQKLSTIPGVVAATPVLRLPVNLLDGQGGSANLIAVDPGVLAHAAWFREDFSDQGIDELAALLDPLPAEEPEPGILLPAEADYLGVWVNTPEIDRGPSPINLSLWAPCERCRGAYRSVGLGSLIDSAQDPGELVGWRFLSGELPKKFLPDDGRLELAASSSAAAPSPRPGRPDLLRRRYRLHGRLHGACGRRDRNRRFRVRQRLAPVDHTGTAE